MNTYAKHYVKDLACIDELAAFVMQYGLLFADRGMPLRYTDERFGTCFDNAGAMALRYNFTYVEGFAWMPHRYRPRLHAWCVNHDGRVFDSTFHNMGENSYFGVPLKKQYVQRLHKLYGRYGFIDLWEEQWPLLNGDPNQFWAAGQIASHNIIPFTAKN